ncbi:hypothetical protein G6F59_018663 [Rhizopus arrhizus]|nr:hypothetical protein G6F59_018663 [Rhizopus arrhizus]
MTSSAPRACISSRPTTEMDCGTSRIGVSVLVAVAVRLAEYPGTALKAGSPVTVTAGSVATPAAGASRST